VVLRVELLSPEVFSENLDIFSDKTSDPTTKDTPAGAMGSGAVGGMAWGPRDCLVGSG